ncbi:levansucrase domain protein [Actinomyces johnsonii F0510]|uniref:Levansucrase domain protein n=1 Tax=Actinomyces johnsonii F0510 TaxID=1227262 RepID=U1QPQ6_9ACTO|nr:glycoside hydrolase family 68 protein [Actinomyces johnsonii]ERH23669.1 levansucrase domain protein [Actinomyces johnsonii F0510]
MTVTHTSFRARRRRLAAALALGLLAAGTGTTAIADEAPSPEPSASATAEASPEAGANQKAGQAPADQGQADQAGQADQQAGQAGQADQQAAGGAAAQDANGFKADNPGWANATKHTGAAHGVEENYTAKWTRADAMQIQRVSDPNAPSGTNSMPEQYTMPEISNGFPATSDDVWVWDTWTLTDEAAHQISYNGWEIAFSLVADRHAGYTFDDRHTHARLGFFYRKAGTQTSSADGANSSNGGWVYGGHVFPDGASGSIFEDQSFSAQTEWSGSARLMEGNKIRMFYTSVAFYNSTTGGSGNNDDGQGNNGSSKPYDPRIVQSEGRIYADENGVWLTGFRTQHQLLVPDGKYYQTREQNPGVNFRDPFTFRDQNNPSDPTEYMVFEGNSAFVREQQYVDAAAKAGQNTALATCTEEDLGYEKGDPKAETVESVNQRGGRYQLANVGLARAKNKAMTQWEYLPPLLSGNCVNDQTERPQIYFQDGKYYLFTISHRETYADGLQGPEGVYGFVGDGLRSDYKPLNQNTGIALGNPINLNFNPGKPYTPDFNQSPYTFQSYSHYVMPGGLVESFIDSIGGNKDGNPVRGGSLAPTVKINISGDTTAVDRTYGTNGLGGFADIPADRARTNGGDSRPQRLK